MLPLVLFSLPVELRVLLKVVGVYVEFDITWIFITVQYCFQYGVVPIVCLLYLLILQWLLSVSSPLIYFKFSLVIFIIKNLLFAHDYIVVLLFSVSSPRILSVNIFWILSSTCTYVQKWLEVQHLESQWLIENIGR